MGAKASLWNGSYGGSYRRVACANTNAYIYVREKENNKVLVILNVTGKPQQVAFTGEKGKYSNVFTGKKETVKTKAKIELQPWEYRVLVR